MRSARLGILAGAALVACTSEPPGPPSLTGMSPDQAGEGRAVEVTIFGTGFLPDTHTSFVSGDLVVGDVFQAFLGDYSLGTVRYKSSTSLGAFVPDNLQAGLYDLRVVDPRGKSDELPEAFEVLLPCDAGVGAEGCPCNYLYSRDGVCAGGGQLDGNGACTTAPTSYEATELTCDGLDNDCDGAADGGCDDDGDGYCDAAMLVAGAPVAVCPNSSAGQGDDCVDDGAGADQINPAAEEICTGGVDENCNGWIDEIEPSCGGGNTPPIPSILVTPGAGAPGQTYTADATGTTDRDEPAEALSYAWDWDNDGTFEATGVTVQKSDFAPGVHRVVLRVTDTDGAAAHASFLVFVVAAANTLVVTTELDENDPEDPQQAPIGDGLSLREAINLSNAYFYGREVTVFVPSGFRIELGSTLPASTDPTGLRVIGDGATLDCSGVSAGPCILLIADNTAYYGLRMIDCPDDAVTFNDGVGNQVSRSTIERCGGTAAIDAAVRFDAPGTFGPDNLLLDSRGNGIYVSNDGRGSVIERNRIAGSGGRAIRIEDATAVTVRQNVLLHSNSDAVALINDADDCVITQNTIHDNGGDGIEMSANISGVDVRNNAFSNNADAALNCSNESFTGGANDWNDFWGNGTDCTCCAGVLPPNSRADDPFYIDAAAGDLRLLQASRLIDAGTDTDAAFDVNGPEPQRWNGVAPDIGAWESP